MGKVFGGVYANWTGKVGNVVARKRQGRTILSIYQPDVHNPRTAAQVSQRNKFGLLTSMLSTITGFIREGFHMLDGYKTGNAFSSCVGYNLKNPDVFSTTQQGELELVMTEIELSEGSLDLPYSPSASAEGTTLSVTWADNSGLGNANTDDDVMVCAYNATKNQGVYNLSLAERNERNATFTLPSSWTGDTVNVWIAMKSKKGECSPSQHLASLAL